MRTEPSVDFEELRERVGAYAEARAEQGVFPYEGEWLTADEIKDRLRRKRISDRIHALELLLLFGFVYLFAVSSWLLISKFCY